MLSSFYHTVPSTAYVEDIVNKKDFKITKLRHVMLHVCYLNCDVITKIKIIVIKTIVYTTSLQSSNYNLPVE